jgi:hypothetical protein
VKRITPKIKSLCAACTKARCDQKPRNDTEKQTNENIG